ncbi:hypothetical protein [uncultured Oscillibacter sp.]|uniref:hypothetical protein n=1 Tax=uncultured Oscillibacter sp. TaxID=876091 RepID=UPI002666CD8A|nr:hypothetical protein [uncultured Oscillibacter sp.]
MRLPPEDHSRSKKRLREGSDPELELIYYLFHVHHWTPEQFSTMSRGAQDLVWGLASYESGNH